MIKSSIYRLGGSVSWTSTIRFLVDSFKDAKPQASSIRITAGEKGWGKSTAFEYLSQFAPGLSIEGDIMSVVAYTLIAGHELPLDRTVAELAKGQAIPGFIPWNVSVQEDKDLKFKQALNQLLGVGWERKISLATSFHGWDYDVTLRIIPDFKFYVDNMNRRTKFMLADELASKEWRERIRTQHVTMKWPEFKAEVKRQFQSAIRDSKSVIVLNIDGLFEDALFAGMGTAFWILLSTKHRSGDPIWPYFKSRNVRPT